MKQIPWVCLYVFLPSRWAIAATTRGVQMKRHHFSNRKLDPMKELKAPITPLKVTRAPTKAASPTGFKKSIKTKVACPQKKKSMKKGPKNTTYDDCMKPTNTAQPSLAPTAYNCASPVGRSLDINNAVSSISNSVTPGTPQAKALSWLLNVDTTTNACNGLDKIRQRYSLAVFYYSTLGSDWINNAYWLGPQDEGSWYGVTCTNGSVTSLFMDMNNLTGTLPTEVASLRSLSELHVYLNNIGGTLPTELGSLTSLSLLDLEVNHFEGKLFFDQLLNTNHTLQYLRGSDNQFVGSIPSWIGDLTGLKEFWAADNSFTGSIPTEITRLTDLASWYIYGNKLNGTIPSSIGSLTNLEEMDLSSNNLHGSIPNSIANLGNLTIVLLAHNSLTGTIPVFLGNISSLLWVDLSYNHLTGDIPSGFGDLTNLNYLYLNDNLLTGPLPDFISPVLVSVFTSNNALNGSIPVTLFDLPSLTYLHLSNNSLTGEIPSSFGDSITLEAIWLDGNHLNGTIPAIPSNGWPKIKEVLLEHNLLTGNMPSSICALRFLKSYQFTALHADCTPPTGVLGQAQLNCENGCCTSCSVGVLV